MNIYTYAKSRKDSDVLGYWKRLSESMNPLDRAAAKLANHYLTAPPSSVDVERLFSEGGDILTDERNRLLPQNASMVLFLKENLPSCVWYKVIPITKF